MSWTYLLVAMLLLSKSSLATDYEAKLEALLNEFLKYYDSSGINAEDYDREAELITWIQSTDDPDIVADMFADQYESYEVQIYTGDDLDFEGKEYRFIVDNAMERIHIGDYSLAVGALQKFGNGIRSLYISDEFSKDILENITMPLDSVQYLKIEVSENAANALKFDESFPELMELTLRLQSDVDYSYINCELPNLTLLNISVTNEAWKRKNQIEGLIRQNPQITSVDFQGFPKTYIKTINRLLPNIEYLALHGFETESVLQFDNLRHLEIYGSPTKHDSPGSIQKLRCPQLRYLEFYYSPNDLNAWRTFFVNHQNLDDLYLREGSSSNYLTAQDGRQLIQMISGISSMTTFKMHETNLVDTESIKWLVENHKKLSVFHFTTFPDAYDVALVRDRPENPWQLQAYYYDDRLYVGDYSDFENILEKSRRQLESNSNN